jgi:hypothetical protein
MSERVDSPVAICPDLVSGLAATRADKKDDNYTNGNSGYDSR